MQKEHSENPETGNRANVVLNAVLSFFDGTNPIFCLVVIVEFCIFALWKNN